MITSKAFAGKTYAVLGLARSGVATVEALLASGAKVVAWDGKEEARTKILPGTGRGTGEAGGGGARLGATWVVGSWPPSTTLRAVPLPVPGRN